MGYQIDMEVDLWVPESILALVLEKVEPLYENLYSWMTSVDGKPVAPTNEVEDPPGRLAWIMQEVYGNGEVDAYEGVHKGIKGWTLNGVTFGKAGEAIQDLHTILAQAGVHGTIDIRGEDGQMWRERLYGGEVHVFAGEIKYPGDPWDGQ